jgi:hypothetical protein
MKSGKTRFMILALFLLPLGAPAASVFDSVTAAQPVCYGREYSEVAMKSRPKQTVQKIQAKLEKDTEYKQNILHIEITLKGAKNRFKNYRAMLFCDQNDECFVECDGGSAKLSRLVDGRLQLKNNGFVIEGGCGGEDEEDGVMLPAEPGGDDIFRLSKLPSAFCQKAGRL